MDSVSRVKDILRAQEKAGNLNAEREKNSHRLFPAVGRIPGCADVSTGAYTAEKQQKGQNYNSKAQRLRKSRETHRKMKPVQCG